MKQLTPHQHVPANCGQQSNMDSIVYSPPGEKLQWCKLGWTRYTSDMNSPTKLLPVKLSIHEFRPKWNGKNAEALHLRISLLRNSISIRSAFKIPMYNVPIKRHSGRNENPYTFSLDTIRRYRVGRRSVWVLLMLACGLLFTDIITLCRPTSLERSEVFLSTTTLFTVNSPSSTRKELHIIMLNAVPDFGL